MVQVGFNVLFFIKVELGRIFQELVALFQVNRVFIQILDRNPLGDFEPGGMA